MASQGSPLRFTPRFARPLRQLPSTLVRTGVLAICLATPMTGLLAATTAVAAPGASIEIAQASLSATVIHVNPAFGNDAAGNGSEAAPLKTITAALQRATPGTVVQLQRGTYTQSTGEVFPLVVPPGVTLRGEEQSKGQTTVVIGGGTFISPTFARQNVTLVAGKDSEIRSVAFTNPNTRGTGIWVESTNAKIENCTFKDNNRDGIFVTGTGAPSVKGNLFTKNGGNGISIARNARGDIHDNVFENTGFGLAIGGNSTPVVSGNRIIQNVDGIYINDSARPLLRNNVIENNQRDGVVATINARPDLGTEGSSGGNTIRGNGKFNINNATSNTLYSVGNNVDTSRIAGRVEFTAPVVASGGGSLRDIQGHWAQAYIEALAKRGVITGFPDGTFRPSDPVTRVQFAVIVNKAFDPAPRQARAQFRDVASNFWGYQAIQSATQGGFMRGYPEGTFLPNQAIPRVQALVALANGLGFGAGSPTVLTRYQDAGEIPSYAVGPIASATQRRIVVNYPNPGLLSPNRQATRAEVAAFVYQALVNAGKVEAISSPYIVSTTTDQPLALTRPD